MSTNKTEKNKKSVYKNRPFNNIPIGIVSGFLIGSGGATFISLLSLIDAMGISSIGIRHDQINDAVIYLSIFGIITVISLIIRRRIVRNLYETVESNLDD